VDDRRTTSRRRILKTGTISFEGQIFECAVRNVSETGACLEFPTRTALPDDFNLFIKTVKMMRRCHVVWRDDRKIGVRFEQIAEKLMSGKPPTRNARGTDQPANAACPKCHTEMRYVTAVSHPNAPDMQRTTFVCYTCNQTRTYMLSTVMAGAHASAYNPAGAETAAGS
jgi:hypothetical protein